MMKVKTLRPLSVEWHPPQLLVRDERLHEMLEETCSDFRPRNLWIEGDRGLGKTLTVRFLMEEIEAGKMGQCFYMTCERSVTRALQKFCSQNYITIPKYEIYPSRVIHEVTKNINTDRLFFIIDDVDKIYHRRRDIDGLVFPIYEHLVKTQNSFCIILISRLSFLHVNSYLEVDTLSRLQLLPMIFRPYNTGELMLILKQRLEYVLDENPLTEETMGAIAQLSKYMVRIGADIRKTLEILHTAVNLAGETLNKIVIDNAWLKEKRRFWKESILKLPKHQALIVYLLAILNTKYNRVHMKMLEIEYKKRAKQLDFRPYTGRMLYRYIEDLEEKGYLERTRGRRFRYFLDITEKPENIIDAGKEIDWDALFGVEKREKTPTHQYFTGESKLETTAAWEECKKPITPACQKCSHRFRCLRYQEAPLR